MKNNNNQQKINEKGILDVLEQKIKLYKKQILITAGIIILAIAAGALTAHLKNKAYQKQWGDLFLAELPLALQTEEEKADLSKLEIYAAANEEKPAGAYAALTLGNAYYQTQNYEKAELYFKQALKNGNKELQALAESSLIAAYIAQNMYDKAIEQANAFEAKYPNHFILAQVKTHKALATELSGKPEEAKTLYLEIAEQYPSSYSASLAKLQADKIK